jgi:hypothetical protein
MLLSPLFSLTFDSYVLLSPTHYIEWKTRQNRVRSRVNFLPETFIFEPVVENRVMGWRRFFWALKKYVVLITSFQVGWEILFLSLYNFLSFSFVTRRIASRSRKKTRRSPHNAAGEPG